MSIRFLLENLLRWSKDIHVEAICEDELFKYFNLGDFHRYKEIMLERIVKILIIVYVLIFNNGYTLYWNKILLKMSSR